MKRGLLTILVCLIAVPAAAATPDEILRSSLALLGQAKHIRVHALVMNDEVIATGQKLQRTFDSTIEVRRPDGLRIDSVADRYRRDIRYDGKMLVVYDPDKKLYGSFDAPQTIDATIAKARDQFGIDLPLGHLFAEGAYELLSTKTFTATYVGLHRVEGTPCHHLAFSNDNVDWQIWIAAEGAALPRRIVIDYKNRPGRPEYIALLSDWNLKAEFSATEFSFTPPAGAEKIDFLPAERASK